jgi:hypothetical protein
MPWDLDIAVKYPQDQPEEKSHAPESKRDDEVCGGELVLTV